MFLLYAVVAIIFLIYVYFKRKYLFWKDRGFPYLEPTFPLGNMSGVGYKIQFGDFLKQQYEKFKNKGPAFGLYSITSPILIITDPELTKDIFVRHFEHFHERGMYFNEDADPLSKTLFTIDGQEWKDVRAKLSPTFTSGRMKMMFPIVAEISNRMIEFLKQDQMKRDCLEMKEIYSSFTTEVIGNVAFGLDIDCLGNKEHEFRKIAQRIFDPSAWENIRMTIIFSMPKLAKFFNMPFNSKETIDYFLDLVRKNFEYREKNNIVRNDFFQLMANMKNSDSGMTFNEIAANCFLFFIAGFETSSSVLTFITYELALNQDIQDRLRHEVEEVLEKHNGEVTYDAIMEMKYLDMVLNESMRKYPIIDAHMRRCAKEFKIPNTNLVIPKGVLIMIPAIGLHWDEMYYENPGKFDPERFTAENVKKQHPFTYIPFSEGPRICVGLRFGVMQTKIEVVQLLRNFRILPCSKTLIPMKFAPNGGFQAPLGGMWLKLETL